MSVTHSDLSDHLLFNKVSMHLKIDMLLGAYKLLHLRNVVITSAILPRAVMRGASPRSWRTISKASVSCSCLLLRDRDIQGRAFPEHSAA